jgi:hypothetical protein
MANTFSRNQAPGGVVEVTVGGVVNVTGPPNGLWSKFSTSSQMQQGDLLMDRTRDLLRAHLQLIEVHQQTLIRKGIDKLV